MAISAFGVEHGEEFSKSAPSRFNTSPGNDPKGYRQAVGNQLNARSGKFHREGSLGSRSKRITRETAKGYGKGALKGAAIGTAAGGTLGLVSGLAAQRAGAKGAAAMGLRNANKGAAAIGAAYGGGLGLGGGLATGAALGGAKGMRTGRQQNRDAGDTASYRRGGKNKSKKSKGQNFFGFERYS